MNRLKAVHRTAGIIAVIFLMYMAATGLMIQSVDVHSLATDAPATDPNVEAMHEGFDGPGDYPVIESSDYTAQDFPANVDVDSVMQRVVQSARTTLGDDPFRYVELRMINGKPVGQVSTPTNLVSFDGATGELIQKGPLPRFVMGGTTVPSLRNTFKGAHRGLRYLGDIPIVGRYIRTYTLYVEVVVGFILILMIITGIWMYFKLLNTRIKQGLGLGLFWVGGNWKRAMHRWVGVFASIFIFILIAAVSGEWLAYESLYYGKYLAAMRPQGQPGGGPGNGPRNGQQPNASGPRGGGEQGRPNDARLTAQRGQSGQSGRPSRNLQGQGLGSGFRIGMLTPVKDLEIPQMTQVTLASYREKTNDAPIKVIRLRHYVNYEQGVIVTGGDDTR